MNQWISGAIIAATLWAPACATQPPEEPAQSSVADNPLSFMFGEWTGIAKGVGYNATPFEVKQTERVGPMLDGAVTVIEGSGFSTSGEMSFNAFAIVSYDKKRNEWEIRSYTNGYVGTFPFEPKEDGYVWSTPAGPDAVMRYTAQFEGDIWREIGEYVPTSGEPRKTYEMTLKRIGDTDWPSAGAVVPPDVAN